MVLLLAPFAIPSIFMLSFLPLKEDMPLMVNIPSAITKFYPLPEEQMMKSYAIGNEYQLLGKIEESLIELDRAVELSPQSPDIYIARGITEEKLLQWDKAIQDYRVANELLKAKSLFKSDDAICISNLANAELGNGQWSDALRDFERAAGLKPGYFAPVIGKALATYQLGREAEARVILSRLAEEYPSFADAKAALAAISYKRGDVELAGTYLEDALEGDNRHTDMDWVRNIRQWTPRLADDLQALLRDGRFTSLIQTASSRQADDDEDI